MKWLIDNYGHTLLINLLGNKEAEQVLSDAYQVTAALQYSNSLVSLLYCIVGFFEVLKFREWLIFSFFTILFSQMGLPKAHTLQ